jgi:SNF2 family DNA or RNA helicase
MSFSSIFVMNIVKSLSNCNPSIQEFSFRILGNLTSALFLQDEKSMDQAHIFENDLLTKTQKGYTFIVNFKNPSNFNYEIIKLPKADLWPYQKEGIKWMGFLAKHNFNGALCDDMGLGKTL